MKTIVVIEPTVVTLPHIPKAIAWLGYQPLLVCQRSNYPHAAHEFFVGVETLEADTMSAASVLAAIEGIDVAGVIATGDRFLRLACDVAEALGVPGPDPSLRAATDKTEIAKVVPEHSPESLLFELSDIPGDAIVGMLERHERIVCKPGRAAGGDGLTIFERGATAEQIRATLAEFAPKFSGSAWLAQQSIDGTLVSLEGYVNGDDFRPLGLSVRHRIGCTETRSYFPRRDGFAAVEARILEIQQELMRRVGFTQGYFHSEYLVDAHERPFLTDPNLGRIGGAGILHQICYSYGVSAARVLAHMIDISLFHTRGDHDLYGDSPRPSKCVIYGLSEPAVFEDLIAPEALRVVHTIVAKQGVLLAAQGRNNRSHIAIVSGLDDDVDAYVGQIEIVTDKGRAVPLY